MALFAADNLHSQTVAALKIFLPLLGLVVLSTLFLVSTSTKPSDPIPYAEADIQDLLREPRLTGPSFSGMTEDGAALTLTAREALPAVSGTDQGGLARDLAGLLETPDGILTTITAGEARLDAGTRQVMLRGGVAISVSSGYELRFNEGQIGLDQTEILAIGGVALTGPMGSLTAGTLSTTPAPDTAEAGPDHYLMVFKSGVRLIYQP